MIELLKTYSILLKKLRTLGGTLWQFQYKLKFKPRVSPSLLLWDQFLHMQPEDLEIVFRENFELLILSHFGF